MLDARAVVEIGTGTGVSGLWLLRGMRADGVLTTVDIEAEHQRLARETFTEAGIAAQRARTIAGAALDVLPRLTDGHYDLVFCDGDKREYAAYLKEALRLLRPGGVVAFDNALWHDRVADPAQRDEETVAIRELGRDGRRARRRWCRCCCPSATGCWWPRRTGRPRPEPRQAGQLRRGRGERSRRQPSATATTSHASIRIGAVPMICEPGDSAALGGERLLERPPGPRRRRRRSSPRTTPPARIRQVLKRSPSMPVNRACEVSATYDASCSSTPSGASASDQRTVRPSSCADPVERVVASRARRAAARAPKPVGPAVHS